MTNDIPKIDELNLRRIRCEADVIEAIGPDRFAKYNEKNCVRGILKAVSCSFREYFNDWFPVLIYDYKLSFSGNEINIWFTSSNDEYMMQEDAIEVTLEFIKDWWHITKFYKQGWYQNLQPIPMSPKANASICLLEYKKRGLIIS
jgi:hypothetical protein